MYMGSVSYLRTLYRWDIEDFALNWLKAAVYFNDT